MTTRSHLNLHGHTITTTRSHSLMTVCSHPTMTDCSHSLMTICSHPQTTTSSHSVWLYLVMLYWTIVTVRWLLAVVHNSLKWYYYYCWILRWWRLILIALKLIYFCYKECFLYFIVGVNFANNNIIKYLVSMASLIFQTSLKRVEWNTKFISN